MSHIINPKETPVAEWYELVKEAESTSGLVVNEELESYLVNLLVRFMDKPEIAGAVLGLDYLQAEQQQGRGRSDVLRQVGDQCLLYSGLYPERAERRRCRISYFVELGQLSYASAANQAQKDSEIALVLKLLCVRFVRLMDILQSMRNLAGPEKELSLLSAVELWQDTGSEAAQKIIAQYSKGFLVKG